jgi:hypothetical protein
MLRRDDTNKNVVSNVRFDRRLKVSQTPWREVVGDRDIGHTLKTEHEKNHDGERRMCTNINTKYVGHDLQTKVKITCRDG